MQPQNQEPGQGTPYQNTNQPPSLPEPLQPNAPQPGQPELRPHEWFQPPSRPVQIPGMPQQNYYAAAGYGTPRKPRKVLLFAISAIAGLLLLAGGAAYAFSQMRTTPDSVFADAVESSLSTKQLKQTFQEEESTMDILYDVERPDDPRVYTSSRIKLFDLDVTSQQYASLQDSYVKFENVEGIPAASSASWIQYKNKWMQERKDGKPVVQFSTTSVLFPDAYLYLFGDWIFGNFNGNEKKEIKDLILTQKVYEYDSNKVEKRTLDSGEAYVYAMKQNKEKLTELNKKVAAIWGVDYKALEEALAFSPRIETFKMYIDIKSKRPVQIETDSYGTKVVTKYMDYNNVTLPAEPVVQADYAQFIKDTEE